VFSDRDRDRGSHQSDSEHTQARYRPWTARRGQILVSFAIMLVMLIGMVAFAVDAGFLMAERRRAQNAADAAALAAARAKLDYLFHADRSTIEINTGKRYGAINAGTTQDDVEVDPDPDGTGDEFVRVTVTRDVQPFFLRMIYGGPWNVTASALAGIVPIHRPYALLALQCGPSDSAGIYINGSGTVNVNQGSIMSNCRIDRSGESSVVTAGGSIDAYGPINAGTLWSAGEGFNQRNPVPDPIVQLGTPPPSRSAAQAVRTVTTNAQLHAAVSNINTANNRCPNGETCVMQPGYYGGNLILDVQGTLQLQSGIYYFGDNFKLDTTSSGARIQGTGVLLYITDNAWFDPGNARINLSAAATSLYADGIDGMLFWIANCRPFLMQSNGQFTLSGVIYAPCSRVRLYGSPGSNGLQAIVGNLELAGSGTFNILFTEYVRADMPRVFLVE
jgi:hypothetical protein